MKLYTRLERAEHLAAAEQRVSGGQAQRAIADDLGVARSTLQAWRAGLPSPSLPVELAAFFETPEGVQWLHRVVLSAQFVITLRAGAGVRMVCEFLHVSGLSAVVGASYGSQQALNAALETAVVEVADGERTVLAEGMTARAVTVCEDETFHPQPCLVALEPVSNFIVLEQYAADRSAHTWTQALERALEGLAVEVIQGTSDEAQALRRHHLHDCQAHHSPDLFHVQHEVSKATSLALARQVKQAETQVAQAEAQWQAERAAEQAYQAQQPRPRGRPPAFAARIQAALSTWARAKVAHDQALARQEEARRCIRALGELYHPYDLTRGQVQSVEQVSERLEDIWTRLRRLAEDAALSERARERLAKAERMTTALLATLTFFFLTVHTRLEALNLPAPLEAALRTELIPALYLERVAARSTGAETRQRLKTLSAERLAPLRHPAHPLQRLSPEERTHLEQVAGDCADLFQRSSSAVEGRNGQLALYHHGRHRLSPRKLAALTAVHNYHIRRPDGTTAAERFFGRAHAPLFESLIERVPLPPRPRRQRPPPARQPYLTPLAA
ncbi:DUF6399 domain-containing protein [Imhoffiella purpurea]|uniref:Uncharacterized protein n=1 Tax=Imhoffiella purpurea TaxID=1249627 RepID=W9V4V0_9GAMM|nr:DUF6399 domain-containing protein [Imhoffiella purpurea]EXJ11961.1 hypothetical protein D779_4233 [Imhoffiella purpurea]